MDCGLWTVDSGHKTVKSGQWKHLTLYTSRSTPCGLLTLSLVPPVFPGVVAKTELIKSKLPNTELGKIWRLADVDRYTDTMVSQGPFHSPITLTPPCSMTKKVPKEEYGFLGN